MIEKLKCMIDQSEDKPKLKSLFLRIAELPEIKQEDALKLIELIVENTK
jgi:DNA-directed RNA polymerase subunit H (RpoH/RPB5)